MFFLAKDLKDFILKVDWFEIITLLIAIYGAALASYEKFKSKTKIKFDCQCTFQVFLNDEIANRFFEIAAINIGDADFYFHHASIKIGNECIRLNAVDKKLFYGKYSYFKYTSNLEWVKLEDSFYENLITDNSTFDKGVHYKILFDGNKVFKLLKECNVKRFKIVLRNQKGEKISKNFDRKNFIQMMKYENAKIYLDHPNSSYVD